MRTNIKTEIVEYPTTINDGKLNKDNIIYMGGIFAGECYINAGYNSIKNEPIEKTMQRIERTFRGKHHSVQGHAHITLNIENIPKILAMAINNEKEYNTSEKSGRYTVIDRDETGVINSKQAELYSKWRKIFESEFTKLNNLEYNSNELVKSKIKNLAKENAREMISVFMPTKLIYTTSFRQWNYIASFLIKYAKDIENKTNPNYFELNFASSALEFVESLNKLNILDERLMDNEKNRKLSIFADREYIREEIFSDVYSVNYRMSFPAFADTQRHRTIHYEIKIPDASEAEFYVPKILENNEILKKEFLSDLESVREVYPLGTIVDVNERGIYENFILKCKERICTHPQLEVMLTNKAILEKYLEELKKKNHPLKDDLKKYIKGARCTFPDYTCPEPCMFKEGMTLKRKL